MSISVEQTRVIAWFGQMVGAAAAMPAEQQAELAAWEAAGGRPTSAWPGWVQYIGEPPWPDEPAPSPKPRRPKAYISRSLAKAVMERDAYRCVRCGTYLDLTCDHIIPESRGGPTTLDNLQTLCRPCNCAKGVS